MTLNSLFGNASITPMAIVHSCILSHSSNVSIYTCYSASVATSTITFDPTGIFVCLDKFTRSFACYYFFITTSVSSHL